MKKTIFSTIGNIKKSINFIYSKFFVYSPSTYKYDKSYNQNNNDSNIINIASVI